MKEYTTTVQLTDDEDAAMQAIAVEAIDEANPDGKTVPQIIENLKNERIVGQMRQWIGERAINLAKIDPAATIAALTK